MYKRTHDKTMAEFDNLADIILQLVVRPLTDKQMVLQISSCRAGMVRQRVYI